MAYIYIITRVIDTPINEALSQFITNNKLLFIQTIAN